MQATTRALSALRSASTSRSALRQQGQRASLTTSVRAPPKAAAAAAPPPPRRPVAAKPAPAAATPLKAAAATPVKPVKVSVQKIRDAHLRREPAEMATLLLRWDWLAEKQRVKLQNIIDTPAASLQQAHVDWLQEEFAAAKSYRSARSRLWVPDEALLSAKKQDATVSVVRQQLVLAAKQEQQQDDWAQDAKAKLAAYEKEAKKINTSDAAGVATAALTKRELRAAAEVDVGRYHRDKLVAFNALEPEARADLEYREAWKKLTVKQRHEEVLRLRFNCIRRLGWRHGYTSGFPISANASVAEKAARAKLVKRTSAVGREDRLAARKELSEADEAAAWADWQSMTAEQRVAEERSAWGLRDRSRLWIDDSSTSLILGTHAPRWYAVAPRAGILTFLPEESVKLVRNYLQPRQPYDAWKATFRIPLDMSRVALRNYLRALYGLETTWVRIMVYRSVVKRSRVGYGKSAKGQRTWKKAEVGLLEPFIYPELTKGFRNEHLMQADMQAEQAALLAKIGGRQRWRGFKEGGLAYPKDAEDESTHLQATHTTTYDGNWITSNPKPMPKEGEDQKEVERKNIRPAVTSHRGGIVTKRAKNILRALGKQRLAKEAIIARRMEEIREQDAAAEKEKK